ncbi:MAG: endonuclease MutS2 [Eubacteriales bacterium]|nr:endonuclease MutS2 [Eubacteriales bacterium]
MEEKTLQILEYNKIIEKLKEYASSEAGRGLCSKLKPSANFRHIKVWQSNTSDACSRIRLKGSTLSFRGVKEIGGILKRLEVGGILSAAELISVSSVLIVSERAVSYGKSDSDEEKEDSLSEMFSMITPLVSINREIQRCIIDEDMIADDASPGLASVRNSMKRTAGSVHEVMQAKLNSCRDYLTDAIITQRDGRYCLPVKAEYKSKVPGMVHDSSSTGLTLFIEPMAVVSLNNKLRELKAEEQKEIEKVLKTLSESLMPYTDTIGDNIKILKKLDMIFAKALYSQAIGGAEPGFSKDRSINMKAARHPLIDKDKVVPIDVALGSEFDQLIITGPNTGGKTVSLKTTGLLTLMAQAGLHIPAEEGSIMGIFDDVYADIGDEQSIEQSLSTFSAHMTNIVSILGKADAASLCLFDELGSGTDPTEGAALGIAILNFLHNMKTRTMATTHYSEIKLYALETGGVENACCEFDVATLKPTYRLLIGVPGKSNAFAISKRLGLPDYIIEDARARIAAENENFEDIIAKLNDDRSRTAKSMEEAESCLRDAEILKERLRKKEEKLEAGRDKILQDAREEAQRILREAKDTADSAIRNINKYGAESDLAAAEEERRKLRSNLKEASAGNGGIVVKGPSKPVSPKKLQVGDEVRIMSMGGMIGTVNSLPDKDGNVFVQMGFMSSKVNVKDIELTGNKPVGSPGGGNKNGRGSASGKASGRSDGSNGYGRDFGAKSLTISPEVNLIGMTTDEALPVLEKYLDDAYLAGLPSVRIVHGRGTGALKNMVHQRLRKTKYVKEFRLGVFGEGDTGVTIAAFK